MIDLTEAFQKAIAASDVWSLGGFNEAMALLQECKYRIFYWEEEEYWATIIREETTVGYLWKRYPLLFVVSDHLEEIRSSLGSLSKLTTIDVPQLKEPRFKITREALPSLLLDGLDSECFSAEDFWFYTAP